MFPIPLYVRYPSVKLNVDEPLDVIVLSELKKGFVGLGLLFGIVTTGEDGDFLGEGEGGGGALLKPHARRVTTVIMTPIITKIHFISIYSCINIFLMAPVIAVGPV